MSSISLVIASAPAPTIGQFLFVAGAKSSLFFLAAALVTFGMRRRAAAARHLIWMAAVVGAALLPVLGVFVPTWNVPVLATSSPSVAPSLLPTSATVLSPATEASTIASATSSAPQEVRRLTTHDAAAPRVDGVSVFLLIWASGAVLFLSRIVFSSRFLMRVRNRATVVEEPAWDRVYAVADRHRHIQLLVSNDIDIPLTWGILRPAILLPRESEEWSQARRELVLRHELAHVTRHDVLSQLLAGVVRALYWPNPLVWLAERSLRRECEQACDDAVLAAGVRPTRYAEELLAIVSELTAPPVTSLAPALASRSSLEVRLHALLDARLRRRRATRLDAALTGIAVLALAVPLAAMKPAERARALEHANRTETTRVRNPVSPTPALHIAANRRSGVSTPPLPLQAVIGGSLGTPAAARLCAASVGRT